MDRSMQNTQPRFSPLGWVATVAAVCLMGSSSVAPAQSWISDIVNRASRAGDRMKAEEKPESTPAPREETPAPAPSTASSSDQDEAARKLEAATGSSTSAAPTSNEPVQAVQQSGTSDIGAAAQKLETVVGSESSAPTQPKPSSTRTQPKPNITLPPQDPSPTVFASGTGESPAQARPEAPAPSVASAPIADSGGVEPESNWGILRDLLSAEMPPVGGTGPILASVNPQATAVAPIPEATPVADKPASASTPKPRSSNASSARRSSSSNSSSSRRQSQPRQQSQPEPRRGLYNPYSVYSR